MEEAIKNFNTSETAGDNEELVVNLEDCRPCSVRTVSDRNSTMTAKKMLENAPEMKKETDPSSRTDFLNLYGETLVRHSVDKTTVALALGYIGDCRERRFLTIEVFGAGQAFSNGIQVTKLSLRDCAKLESSILQEITRNYWEFGFEDADMSMVRKCIVNGVAQRRRANRLLWRMQFPIRPPRTQPGLNERRKLRSCQGK